MPLSSPSKKPLKNLTKSFKGFFEGKNGRPVFKKKSKTKSIHFPQGFKILCDGKVFLPKIGYVDFIQHHEIPKNFNIKNVFVCEKGGNWYVSFQGEMEKEIKPFNYKDSKLKPTSFDLGVKHFCATFYKEFIKPLNKYQSNLDKLTELQRKLSLKTKDSNSWKKLKLRISKLHHHIANARKDFN